MTNRAIIQSLRLIADGVALKAVIEYELEDRGLITTNHEPYAKLTPLGRLKLASADMKETK
jgi:hypothetical protein